MKKSLRAGIIISIAIPLFASKCEQFEVDDRLENIVLDQFDCTKNESQACRCLNGWEGYQLCDPEEGGWSTCICEPPCTASPEVCDGVDNDCDNATDENAADALTWYADRDNDGIGDANNIWVACTAPSGFVATDGDLDDACETCTDPCEDVCDDGIDNDCDGLTDGEDDICITSLPDAGSI